MPARNTRPKRQECPVLKPVRLEGRGLCLPETPARNARNVLVKKDFAFFVGSYNFTNFALVIS